MHKIIEAPHRRRERMLFAEDAPVLRPPSAPQRKAEALGVLGSPGQPVRPCVEKPAAVDVLIQPVRSLAA